MSHSIALKNNAALLLRRLVCLWGTNTSEKYISTSACVLTTKHYNPKFSRERGQKVLKVTLLDFDELRREEKMSTEEMRAKLKEKGIAPYRQWNERPMVIDCSGDFFDQYVPPEGDGKISSLSTLAIKQRYEGFSKKSKSYLALRKIRNMDYEFDVPTVANNVQSIYIEAHKALSEKNETSLHELVTEKAFPEMMENTKCKTIKWSFLQSLEPPRIVHIRVEEMMSKKNVFAQLTVRLHTQQLLAVYDRFGRLIHGSETDPKDVLEYVVFEKHITNPYGLWRIHGKIIPDWLPPREPIIKTFCRPNIDAEYPEPPEGDASKEIQKENNEVVATA